MFKYILFIGGSLATFVLIAALFIFLQPRNTASFPVAATIFPVYDITRMIAGDAVAVSLIVPVGTSTHTFDPSPSTIQSLQGTQVIYAIGHGADDWIDPVLNSVAAEKVVVDAGITLRATELETDEEAHADDLSEDHDEHEDEIEHDEHEDDDSHEGHSHGPIDPHYWLTFPNVEVMARTIAVDLSTRFPEHADVFEANLATYVTYLTEADEEVRSTLNGVAKKEFISTHDAWYYFAEEYGLALVGTFEPTAGREATAQYINRLTDTVSDYDLRVIYTEPQLATTAISSFANDLDLAIATIDPIGGTGSTQTLIKLILSNARTIAENN